MYIHYIVVVSPAGETCARCYIAVLKCDRGCQLKRMILGFIIAPLVPGLLLFTLGFAVESFSPAKLGSSHLGEGVWLILFSSAVSYPVALVIGVPILLLALRNGFVRWYHSALVGLILGLALSVLLSSIVAQSPVAMNATLGSFLYFLLFGPWGFFVALAFWIVGRPDKYHEAHFRNATGD
jgi:uncharacterized membrane protein